MSEPVPEFPPTRRKWKKRATRERSIQLRVSQAEYDAFKAKAKEAGQSVSELLRDHVGKVSIRNRADELQHRAALGRIGSNLNQIAKWGNTYKGAADAVQVMGYLSDVRRSLDRLLEAFDRR